MDIVNVRSGNPGIRSGTTGVLIWVRSKLELPRVFRLVVKRAMFLQVHATWLLSKRKRLILPD